MSLTLSPAAVQLSARDTASEVLLTTVDAAPARSSATAAPVQTGLPRSRTAVTDVVEEWGLASFPASDPPSNW